MTGGHVMTQFPSTQVRAFVLLVALQALAPDFLHAQTPQTAARSGEAAAAKGATVEGVSQKKLPGELGRPQMPHPPLGSPLLTNEEAKALVESLRRLGADYRATTGRGGNKVPLELAFKDVLRDDKNYKAVEAELRAGVKALNCFFPEERLRETCRKFLGSPTGGAGSK
jgi:hypothetical protein